MKKLVALFMVLVVASTAVVFSGCTKSTEDLMENAKVNLRNATLTLFVTPTCPNCKIVERLLDQKGIKYNTVDATTHKDEVEKLGIASAPTLLLSRDEGVEVISSIGAITNLIKRF